MGTVKVLFLPEGRSAQVEPGTTIAAAAVQAGVFVDAPCGGRGTCGKCRVQVEDGHTPLTAAEYKALTAADIDDGWRLACQAEVVSDAVVRVPVGSLQIAVSGAEGEFHLQPNVRKVFVSVAEPSLEDQRPDLARVREALAGEAPALSVDVRVARDLGQVLRAADYAVTVVLIGDRCVGIEPGDTRESLYGVAFDIGTTTVVGTLHDLNDGRQVAVASALNGQARYGADVISRINFAMTSPSKAWRRSRRACWRL